MAPRSTKKTGGRRSLRTRRRLGNMRRSLRSLRNMRRKSLRGRSRRLSGKSLENRRRKERLLKSIMFEQQQAIVKAPFENFIAIVKNQIKLFDYL